MVTGETGIVPVSARLATLLNALPQEMQLPRAPRHAVVTRTRRYGRNDHRAIEAYHEGILTADRSLVKGYGPKTPQDPPRSPNRIAKILLTITDSQPISLKEQEVLLTR